MGVDKDDKELKNRLLELADKSYKQDIFTFSSFLGLGEQDVFHSIERELAYAKYECYGGHAGADRIIVRFGSEEVLGYELDYPIACIHIEPVSAKFAESLTHRDFLGSIMNLGIERATVGDIVVNDKEAWVFCLAQITEYICENLTKVRHNNVKCSVCTDFSEVASEEPVPCVVQVASMRADAVISKVYHLSREASLNLFRAQKVYINGRLCENNSKELKSTDVVNARGFGKFEVDDDIHVTRKGKQSVSLKVYK